MASSDCQAARSGALYDLLMRKFSGHRSTTGVLDIPRLAKDANLSHETVYRAVRGQRSKGFPDGKLTVEVASALLRLSGEMYPKNPLYAEDVLPFVIPFFAKYSDPAGLLD